MINKPEILNLTDKLILRYFKNYCLKRNGNRHPYLNYQPLPWIGISKSIRSTGCYERIKVLLEFLKTHKIKKGVVLDAGCSLGFFSLSLKEKGFCVYGIDRDKFVLAIADILGHSIRKGNFFPINMSIDERTVEYLPSADICLCLSIWHHWVTQQGLKNASAVLKSLYKKTNRVLFFETVNLKASKNFSINDYLVKTLNADHVLRLGESSVPRLKKSMSLTSLNGIDKRELFAVVKKL